jgi:hypothetical protein
MHPTSGTSMARRVNGNWVIRKRENASDFVVDIVEPNRLLRPRGDASYNIALPLDILLNLRA